MRITVYDLIRKVNLLSKAIWDKKIITEFTRSISSTRVGQPVLMMNLKVFKDKNIGRWVARENLIYVRWNRIKNRLRVWFKERFSKFKWRPRIFIKPSFRELCNSKLSSLHAFDHVAIFIKFKFEKKKIEMQDVSWWDTNPRSNFCDPHWELICRNKCTQGPQKYPHHRK